MRNVINGLFESAGESLDSKLVKSFKAGDLIEPFIKTPANIIQFGLDVSGLGGMKGTAKLIKYARTRKLLETKEATALLRNAFRDLTNTGLGLGGAFLLTSAFDKDDFIGAYDPQRVKYEELRNGNFNALRIGGKWVSLDYFGPVAMPLVGMLYAKKYGDGNKGKMLIEYVKGIGNQATKAPFVSSIYEMYSDVMEKGKPGKGELGKYIADVFTNQIASRVPGILQDIAKITDSELRDTTKNIDKILAKIPLLSKYSPEKKDMFGEVMKTETGMADDPVSKFMAAVSQIAFGARVKTEKSEAVKNEVLRLKDAGQAPTITSWKYIRSEKLQKLKDKVGNKEFQRIFTEEYGKPLREGIAKLIVKPEYKKLSDEDKKKQINALEDSILEGKTIDGKRKGGIYDKYNVEGKKKANPIKKLF